MNKKIISWLVILAVAVGIWLTPAPASVDPKAWHLLAIFVATVLGLILEPIPMGAVAICGITATAVTGTLSIKEAMTGFSNTTIWLIVMAFFISRAFIKSGLGARIGYIFMRLMGKRTLTLSYGLLMTDFILAPAIPSNTARTGGIVFPLANSVADAYGSKAEEGTSGKLGSFLMTTVFHGTTITGAMFLTGMAANPLAAKLAADMGIDISWGQWALAAIVPGLVGLILMPLFAYMLNKPSITATPQAPQIAAKALADMGKMKTSEWVTLGTFIALIGLWIAGPSFGLHGTTAAMIGLALLVNANVLTWDDVLKEKGAWNTLTWFSALVMMATFLNKLGLIKWFGGSIAAHLTGLDWPVALLALALIYYYIHYAFASSTAHVAALYSVFLAVAVQMGAPGLMAAIIFGVISNLMGGVTHYGTGPAPILFGAGHVSLPKWWGLGFIMGLLQLVIWAVVGGIWWKVIGLY
ncbi:anion permease [Shewanella yunxiaonensis]|uniref:Anion permease n=1 Tax=Shewanella yunxiaonensis TaxID=2829809 RepID=A0ABX7YSK0_9GAMM|nr:MULTISPECIES: anion permease [Shewanella]MDF0535503.1 anion permease [Shewanella sp. A32]QUN05281.1 anion permease [Shewanella yunxiaonensis]